MASEKIDWNTVIAYLHFVQGNETLPYSPETAAYIRLQRFIRKHRFQGEQSKANATRDSVLRMAKEFNLDWRLAARLYITLSTLHATFHIGKAWEDVSTNGAAATALGSIVGSVKRVAKFSKVEDSKAHRAINFVINAADRWAEKQEFSELQRYGFTQERFVGSLSGIRGIDYGSRVVIRHWFAVAPLMYDFVVAAKARLESMPDASTEAGEDQSAIVRLVGKDLPGLYERVTGKRFGLSKAEDRVRDTTGIKFVRMAMAAMGIYPLTPETIAYYWKVVRRTQAGVKYR